MDEIKKRKKEHYLLESKNALNSIYSMFKKYKLCKNNENIEKLNFSLTRKKLKSYRNIDKFPRQSSASSIFSRRLNFRNEYKPIKNDTNLNILDLVIENNPNRSNYKKIKKKISTIDSLYKNESFRASNDVKDIYYKYNILYGQDSSNLIRTYSPKMRPMSSSVKKFVKKMNTDQSDNIPVFSLNEINQLIKNKCSDLGIDVKEHMINKFKNYCNIKCKNRNVDLSENFLGLNSIKFISNILFKSDRIAKLNLSKNSLGDTGVKILMNVVKDSKNLILLNIASNGITCVGGNIVFKHLINQQSIIDFDISTIDGSNKNRNRLTFSGIKDIITFLTENLIVETFNLGGNSIKNEGFIAVCKGLNENNSIISLKLSHNEIGEKGIIQGLKNITNPINKLVYLDLSKNNLSDEGIIALSNQFNDFPSLYSLNISCCGFEFHGFNILLKNLQYTRKIEKLNVSGNKLASDNFEKIKPYFIYLTLRSLNMSRCSLNDNCTYKLGECIQTNFTLKKINISNNNITDTGFKSFGYMFYKNSVITHFDCSANFLTNNGIINFIKSLEVNNTLTNINLYDNQLQNDICNLIIEVLRSNRTLTTLNLYFNKISVAKIEEINKYLKANADNQKQKYIPNLARSVKDLEFNPNQFQVLTNQILSRKIERDFLYKKVKEEDNIYSSAIQENQKGIDIKMSECNDLSLKIEKLEESINYLNNLFNQEKKSFDNQEYKLKDRIHQEEKYLKDIMTNKAIVEKEYKMVELENENIYNLTEEKFNLSERALMNVSTTLKSLSNALNKKEDEYQKLISMKNSRNINKRSTSVKKVGAFQKSKNSTMFSNTIKSTRSSMRFSVVNRNDISKESSLFNLKENEIKEEEEKNERFKRKKTKTKRKTNIVDKNKFNMNKNLDDKMYKNFYKMKSVNQILYFSKSNSNV